MVALEIIDEVSTWPRAMFMRAACLLGVLLGPRDQSRINQLGITSPTQSCIE